MSAPAWTPGKWRAEPGVDPSGRNGFFVVAPGGVPIWSDNNGDGGVASEADARVMALAPELAEALREMVEASEGQNVMGGYREARAKLEASRDRARSVLAKLNEVKP